VSLIKFLESHVPGLAILIPEGDDCLVAKAASNASLCASVRNDEDACLSSPFSGYTKKESHFRLVKMNWTGKPTYGLDRKMSTRNAKPAMSCIKWGTKRQM
jgi:hypothetical protein